MISEKQLWGHLPTQGAHCCPKLCRQLLRVMGIDLMVCSPHGVPFACTQASLTISQILWKLFLLLSFSSCLFCCQKNQKAKMGDSSCEEDTRSPRSQLKQAITSQVRTFQWQAVLGWENRNWVRNTVCLYENILQELANLNEKLMKI